MKLNILKPTLIAALIASTSCANQEEGFAPSRDDSEIQGLVIEPPVANVSPQENLTFSAKGGTGAYTFEIAEGTAQILESTGQFSAGDVGEVIVRVTDSDGRYAEAVVFVTSTLSVNATQLTLHYGESFLFAGSGGVPPYSYSIIAGAGTIFQNQGTFIAGSPDTTAIVRTTDSNGDYVDAFVTVIP